MPSWSTKLPEAMDALIAAYRTAPELTGVTVRDGPSTSQATVMEVVSVGYTGDDGEKDAEADTRVEGMGADRERITIRCVAAVLKGGNDIPAARKRAYELLTAAGAAIGRDPRLGGTVMRARISGHTLQQHLTDRGAQAVIVFTVDCDAFTGR